MPFLNPVHRTNQPRNFNLHMVVTGIFIGLSYVLSLLPLALFAIAQTLAIFGKRSAFVLSFGVVLCLCLAAVLTGFAPLVMGAFFSVISIPLFLIVAILRQKKTSILWSAAVLSLPLFLFFGTILSAPALNREQYSAEVEKIEHTLLNAQQQNQVQTTKNEHVYDKAFEQLEVLKRDSALQNFMGYDANQRILYFVYGNGFSVLLGILLSFFASLFFLDFAFEQVEKLQAIKRYVSSLPAGAFDSSFLVLLKGLTFDGRTDDQKDDPHADFKIVKHVKFGAEMESEKHIFGVLRKPKATNTIVLRDSIFYYAGKVPGWNLRNYQMPLILCVLSIMVLAGTVFYFGDVQNILNVVQTGWILSLFVVVLSVLSICALSFLVLQGIFTTLKWVPFGLLVFLSIVFLIVSPYIMLDMGPYLFLGVFGVIGLLGYLK